MKKLTALLLALVMLLGLCACGAPKDISIQYDDEETKKLEFDLSEDYDEDELTLTAVLEPKGAKGEIEWESSDKDVVKVKDNGDGTCTLKLKGEGDAKVTASCGDLSAKVKISVEGDETETAEAAEEAAPAVEEAVEAEETASAGPVFGECENVYYSVNGSDNEAGLPFTPNDLIASNLISMLENSEGAAILNEFYQSVTGGEKGGTFSYDCGKFDYTMRNYRFTSFTTYVNGATVKYTLKYDSTGITGLEADFGSGNITYMDFDMLNSGTIKSYGYGGEQQSASYDEEIRVNEYNGGLVCWYNGNYAVLCLGLTDFFTYSDILTLYVDPRESGEGLIMDRMVTNWGEGVNYVITAYEDGGNYRDADAYIEFYGEIFDGYYYVYYYIVDNETFFYYYDDENSLGMNFFFYNGENFNEASYYSYSDYVNIYIDADGNLI